MSVSSIGASGSLGGTYGLSGSGLDVDSLVKKLMAGQQAKDDALVQKQTVLQWQKVAYNTMSDDLTNFRNTIFNYKLQSTLSPNKVTSSNTSVATATAGAAAAEVNHSLVVTQLASGVNLTSSAPISATKPPTLGTLATQIYNNTGVPSPFQISISNGTAVSQPITIDPTNNSINDVVSAINNAGVNVTASYDSTLDRMFLTTTNTGSTTGINISSTVTTGTTDNAAAFIGKLNLFPSSPITSVVGSTTTTTYSSAKGLNAMFSLDSTPLTETSNAFTISGVTYALAGVSTGGPPATPTTISVTSDINTAVASVQSFVDSYNKILAEVNGKVNEPRYTDYPPLTNTQKAAMKDSDIVAWNVKAQSGMLHSDSTLTSLVDTMRSAVSSPVSGIASTNVSGTMVTYNSAASIGITTGNYTEGGKLYLNTDKLRTALQANPNVLNQLFGASGSTTVNGVTTTNTASEGIAGRLYDGILNTTNQLAQIAGTTINAQYDSSSNLAQEITAYTTQITDATATFTLMQSHYYTQYNAMEVALQQLSSQSSWLTSQLGTTTTG